MRKWLAFFVLLAALLVSSSVSAQGEIKLSALTVELLPEYDQPSMLVIQRFTLLPGANLPVDLNFRIPADATLSAVAFEENGSLFNANYQPQAKQGDWQVLTLTVDKPLEYRIEYYVPLARDGITRQFVYTWEGDYAVDQFLVRLQVPDGATNVVTDPQLAENTPYYEATLNGLGSGQKFNLKVEYQRQSDALTVTGKPVQPIGGSLDENTAGRLNRYLPYIIAALGLALILGGGIWYWQVSQGGRNGSSRKRHAPRKSDEASSGEPAYCYQCGQRAQPGDRFCRVCGTRLRRE